MWFGNQSGTGNQTDDDNKKGENHEEEDGGGDGGGGSGGDRAGRARVAGGDDTSVIGQSVVGQ